MKPIVGIDLDGVLCNFNSEFLRISRKLLGKPEKGFVVTNFHYDQCGPWTKPEVDRVINWMRHTTDFWLGLDKLPNTNHLSKIQKDINCFFITARFSTDGLPTNYQSEEWIRNRYGIQDPFVIVESNKGKIAKELSLDYFLDDRIENTEAVLESVPTCKVFLQDATWNKTANNPKIERVSSVNEFLKKIG